MKTYILLLAVLVLVVMAAKGARGDDDGCKPSFTRDPSVRQTKKNKIRVGWGRKVDNLDCVQEARVVYSDCTGVDGEGGYGMKIVPRSRGNGASFLVQPNRCYEVSVTLVGTDGSYTASSAVTIQLESNPTLEVVE